jgi:hypothetical protein
MSFRSVRFNANTGLYLNEQNAKVEVVVVVVVVPLLLVLSLLCLCAIRCSRRPSRFCNHNNFAAVGMAVPGESRFRSVLIFF